MTSWVALTLSLLAATPASERRALVVAFNDPDTPSLEPLQYADDDGLLWTEALERLGYRAWLLTVPDLDTARRGSPALARASPPTQQALHHAVEEIRRANAIDRAAGRPTDSLVIYVGHGDVDAAGRAYLTLLGGRLYRDSLYAEVVDRVGADFVHLVVDACHASGVVGGRGGDPAVLKKLGDLLQGEIRTRPTTGTTYAESELNQTHEWSRIRAGVFSHIARSALLGAADVNADGRIEYSELESFASAAMAKVAGAPSQLSVRASPPAQDPRRPLADQAPRGPELVIPPDLAETRLSISDDQGTRLLDLHRVPGEGAVLRLPPRQAYWLSTPTHEARVAAADLGGTFPRLVRPEVATRGAEAEGLNAGLFQEPFGRAFYDGFVAVARVVPVTFSGARSAYRLPPRAGRGWTGLEFGASLGQAPLSVEALSYGAFMAWRTEARPLRFGARASYGISPGAWIARGTMHRVALLATAGWEGPDDLTPSAELGLGLSMVGITGLTGPQADLTIPTARVAVGGRWRWGESTVRASLSIASDLPSVDGVRRLTWVPALELGVER
ncbi:MAG TPA: caspase family protein [Myxococcales bacterium]|nr:caspase family protein [Myxococcales bacterium]